MQLSHRLKDLYVPSAGAGRSSSKTERTAIPAELASLPTGRLFRGLPWSGADEAATFDEPDEPRREVPVPREAVQTCFSTIPWTGEAAAPPTSDQQQHSVRSILAGFDWE